MFELKQKKFYFRCEACKDILSSEFEDDKDIEDIKDDLLWLECPCGGKTYLLRD